MMPPADFPYLRQVIDPSLAALPPELLRAQIDGRFGEGFADSMDEDLEGLFGGIGRALGSAARDVGKFARDAAPAVATIGGGALQGAMSGAAVGGLPGLLAGAAIGGTGAGLSRYGSGAAKQVGSALSGVTQLAGQMTPMGRAGSALGGTVSALGGLAGGRGARGAAVGQALGSLGQLAGAFGGAGGAAGGALSQLAGLSSLPQVSGTLSRVFGGGSATGQLASAIQRPEMAQAVAARRLGDLGASSIPVGPQQTPVPTAAFAQLLAHLAGAAAAEMADPRDGAVEGLAFMSDGEGGYAGDPANGPDRAARLWDMLNDAQAERFVGMIDAENASDDEDVEDIDTETEWYDALDLADCETIEWALETESGHVW